MTPSLEAKQRHGRRRAYECRCPLKVPREALRPEHVVGEEHRQIHDDTDHSGRDAGQWRREFEIAMRGLDKGRAQQDEKEGGQKGEESHHRCSRRSRQKERFRAKDGLGPAADKADEGHHHDERPGRCLTERQAINHLWSAQPLVMLDRPLEHIGQHGISAAEGHQRGLGEEPTHLRQDRIPAVKRHQDSHAGQPQGQTRRQDPAETPPGKHGVFRCRSVVIDKRWAQRLGRFAVATAWGELVGRIPSPQVTDDAGGQHDDREWQL